MSVLEKVNNPSDIRSLSTEELKTLCAEIRSYIVECCAVNPGHVGSSLGAVELIVGLHHVYNTPHDKIVFDVGHQAYAHKILTERKDLFRKNRTKDGISGFPKMDESEYDAFGTGHSSTSISAALGYAEAAKLLGKEDKAIAIIGDGALTGGLALEGLNNAGYSKSDILVILNDNNISIDANTGAFHRYLLKLTTAPFYNKLKTRMWNCLGEGKFRAKFQEFVHNAKSSLVRHSGGALFESLGFRYFGPIDGNDIVTVIDTLRRLKEINGPRILHVITKKGKGYKWAEEDPVTWHAPGRFDPKTGERIVSPRTADRYQDVFGAVLTELADKDERVVGITPAMATGCGMTGFAHKYPKRFFDVGIEEEHAVTFSAGLAAGGLRPLCNIYSSFSQRAYDEIIHDVALQGLPVVFCFDRSGLVGEDGATHHGCFDLAAYRPVPGCIICVPKDETELKNLMYSGLQSSTGPYMIRYPRGCGEGSDWKNAPYTLLKAGKGEKVAEETSGCDIAILALGPEVNRAREAAIRYEKEFGCRPAVYNMRFLKPVDKTILDECAEKYKKLLTVEDGSLKGGLYGEVCEYFGHGDKSLTIYGSGIPDTFISQDSQKNQRHECGLDAEGIFKKLCEISKNNPKSFGE